IGSPPTFHDLSQEFGNSWRVRQGDSLFDYAPGQTTATFTNRHFPTKTVTSSELPDHDNAQAICRSLGITETAILQNCTLDIAITGQAAFSNDAIVAHRVAARGCTALPYAVATRPTIRPG